MRNLRLFARRLPAAIVGAGLATVAFATFAPLGGDTTPPAAGRADMRGDDDRDGRISEDEQGWNCRTMGNRICGVRVVPAECRHAGPATTLCVTVANRPAYGWTNEDGSRVDLPDGRAQVRDLGEKPGTPEFADALRALDAEWRDHR
ncbi:hypothetical protein [Streptomyces sp. NPDC020965]|uniref:hypothetical protein n=1 Tax=Streptomyces sp. NPDC020965 TaxID=3365105 RepID=UPI0037944B1C